MKCPRCGTPVLQPKSLKNIEIDDETLLKLKQIRDIKYQGLMSLKEIVKSLIMMEGIDE